MRSIKSSDSFKVETKYISEQFIVDAWLPFRNGMVRRKLELSYRKLINKASETVFESICTTEFHIPQS